MSHLRRLLASGSTVVLLAAVTACAGSGAGGPGPAAPPPPAATASGAPAFPAVVPHRYGTTEVKAAPRRVAVVGLVEQDALLAMGVVPVATTEWFGGRPGAIFDWAKDALGAAPTPTVLTANDGIDFEAVAAQRPDLILGIASGMTKQDYDRLSRLAPTIAQIGPVDYELNWRDLTRRVGQAIGKPAEADRIVADIDARFASLRTQYPLFAGKEAVLATPYQGYGVYSSQDPRSQVIGDLGLQFPEGLQEIVGTSFFGNLSRERIDLLDADVLVWFVEQDAQRRDIENDRLYTNLPVAQEGRAIFLDDDDELYRAFQFASVLSIPLLLDRLPGLLAAAVDGDPTTAAAVTGAPLAADPPRGGEQDQQSLAPVPRSSNVRMRKINNSPHRGSV
ncbi:MAG: iron-siderophore ABC transporter substrate-binding protein [Sporichthyaceae bacterium]